MRISLFLCLLGPHRLIKNVNIPACRHCVHFSPDGYPKCALFGEKDIVTNEIDYSWAETCRQDETKCGKKGAFFEKDETLGIYLKHFRHPIYIYIFKGFIFNMLIIIFLNIINQRL